MQIPNKLINLVKMLYKSPAFFVELDGEKSDTFTQTTGINWPQGAEICSFPSRIAAS